MANFDYDEKFLEQYLKYPEVSESKSWELNNRAIRLKREGNLQLALKMYEAAIQACPYFDPELWCNIGHCYRDLSIFRSAIKAYEKSLSKNPSDYKTLWGMGVTYMKMRGYANSIDTFNLLLKVVSERKLIREKGSYYFSSVYLQIGDANAALKNKEAAISAYEQAKKMGWDRKEIDRKIQYLQTLDSNESKNLSVQPNESYQYIVTYFGNQNLYINKTFRTVDEAIKATNAKLWKEKAKVYEDDFTWIYIREKKTGKKLYIGKANHDTKKNDGGNQGVTWEQVKDTNKNIKFYLDPPIEYIKNNLGFNPPVGSYGLICDKNSDNKHVVRVVEFYSVAREIRPPMDDITYYHDYYLKFKYYGTEGINNAKWNGKWEIE